MPVRVYWLQVSPLLLSSCFRGCTWSHYGKTYSLLARSVHVQMQQSAKRSSEPEACVHPIVCKTARQMGENAESERSTTSARGCRQHGLLAHWQWHTGTQLPRYPGIGKKWQAFAAAWYGTAQIVTKWDRVHPLKPHRARLLVKEAPRPPRTSLTPFLPVDFVITQARGWTTSGGTSGRSTCRPRSHLCAPRAHIVPRRPAT